MSWLRRNTGWLLALIPALLLALAASSFRYTQIYLPLDWTQPVHAQSAVGTLEQTYRGYDDQRRQRTVTVEVLGVTPVESFDGHAAVVGATMWQLDLRFSADPEQHLMHCEIELVDAEGTRYGFEGGRRAADPDDAFYSPVVVSPRCVPEDAPGPSLNPITGEPVESPEVRPDSWELATAMVLPDGYEPQQVRIGWDKPSFLVLDVP